MATKLSMADPKHVMDRTLERVGKQHVKSFVRGMKIAASRYTLTADWAIKIVLNGKVLGVAVGRGRTWSTTLKAGFQPRYQSQFYTINL